ncbi:hypothetical protein MJH12_07895 [bacterium]|nr:hypothetical protein [bacterium]
MKKILLFLTLSLALQNHFAEGTNSSFNQVYGIKSKSAYSKQHKFSRNEITSFLYKFYGVAGKITQKEEIMPFLNKDYFHANVKILNKDFTGADTYAQSLLDLRKKYPRVDRYIDKVDVNFLEEGQYSVDFRLTSQLYDANDKFLFTFRAKLQFVYQETEGAYPALTEYLVTPSLRTLTLTVKEKTKHFFSMMFK